MKYVVRARIEVAGVVEKPDIIGAIFGQTEGLFSPEYDLRELQDKGRIGRITVDVKQSDSKTVGEIIIPSNLDKVETALMAALIETVDRVGPYATKIKVVEIVDLRQEKLKKVIERAKEILRDIMQEKTIDVKEVLTQISEAVKVSEIIEYGPEKLPAGPEVETSDTLIIVEGRADVINLLKYGYKNVIAIEGAKGEIPKTLINLANSKKKVIVFVDGDRVGAMIAKNLANVIRVDAVARAPSGREVEELTSKEIQKALKNAVPLQTFLQSLATEVTPTKTTAAEAETTETTTIQVPETEAVPKTVEVLETYMIPNKVLEAINNLKGSLEAILYDENWNEIDKIPVKDLVDYILTTEKPIYAVIMDGIATPRLIDAAAVKNVKFVLCYRVATITKKPADLIILTFDELLQ
ncbi:MAG: DNA primase DnaG [Desulfurococcaceae archaeon TW002]